MLGSYRWLSLLPDHMLLCSATKEATTSLNEPMRPTLDEALEYVVDDELVEVTVDNSFGDLETGLGAYLSCFPRQAAWICDPSAF